MSKKKNINNRQSNQIGKSQKTVLNKSRSIDSGDRQKLRKKYHIWTWLILFCPVGIYRSIKYKCFSKPINILLIITLCLCIILGIDNALYPDRVLDNNLKKNFASLSEEYKLGDYRFGEKIGTIKNKYIIYSVTSTTGTYDFYLDNASGKSISAVSELTSGRKRIFISNEFDNYLKDTYPEILRIYTQKDLTEKFGELKKIKNTVDSYQEIEYTNGTFRFQVDKGVVIGVYKISNNGLMEEVYNNSNTLMNLPNRLTNYLSKNEKRMGKLGTVISYTLNADNREYVIRMTNANYHKMILYDDGTIEIYHEKNNISVSDNK